MPPDAPGHYLIARLRGGDVVVSAAVAAELDPHLQLHPAVARAWVRPRGRNDGHAVGPVPMIATWL